MKKTCRFLLMAVLLTGSLAEAFTAIADENVDAITFNPPKLGYFGAQEQLRFSISDQISAEELQQLKLEVDNIDVTSFIVREGNSAIYKPVQPFAWGKHNVRIVQYTGQGEIFIVGEWSFDVRKSKLFREATLNAALNISGVETVAQRDQQAQANPFNGSGTFAMDASVANQAWKATIGGAVTYDGANGNPRNGKRSIDMANFLATAQSGPLTVRVGEHNIQADTLLVQNGINSRGLSASLNSDILSSSITGFAMRTSPVLGFQHGFAIGNSNDRIQGVAFQSFPVANDSATIKVAGLYVYGNGTQAGSVVGGDPTSMGGSAVGGTVDGVFFSSRLRMRGEYAHTKFDFDGAKGALSGVGDYAYSALGSLKLLDNLMLANSPASWVIGFQRKYYGSNFSSVANISGGVYDSEISQLYTQANWADFSLNGEIDQGFDNTNDNAAIPKNRTRVGMLTAGWNPQADYDDQGNPDIGFFGIPSLSASVTSQQVLTVTQGGRAAARLDTLTNSLLADVRFTYAAWNWHSNYTVTWLGNHTDLALSTRTDSASIDAMFSLFNQKLTVSPQLELLREKNRGTHLKLSTVHPNLAITAIILQNKLSGSVSVDATHSFSNDAAQNSTAWQVNGSIDWVAVQAQRQKPGLIFSLKGNYSDLRDRVSVLQSFSNYQLLLNATLDWNGGI